MKAGIYIVLLGIDVISILFLLVDSCIGFNLTS